MAGKLWFWERGESGDNSMRLISNHDHSLSLSSIFPSPWRWPQCSSPTVWAVSQLLCPHLSKTTHTHPNFQQPLCYCSGSVWKSIQQLLCQVDIVGRSTHTHTRLELRYIHRDLSLPSYACARAHTHTQKGDRHRCITQSRRQRSNIKD